MENQETIVVAFVHGYQNLSLFLPDEERPSLWVNRPDGSSEVMNYPFPRNPGDFVAMRELIKGDSTDNNIPDFAKLPRFGLTGISEAGEYLFAGSWNGVYKIKKSDFGLEEIISNRLMMDIHGIWADDEEILTVLTSKDTLVITDHDGNVKHHLSIDRELNVFHDEKLNDYDWRFVSKQFRGATGFWHFNAVQKISRFGLYRLISIVL